MKPLVYIASPYTLGDTGANVHCSVRAMNYLLEAGECVPISPVALTHFSHIMQPKSYARWMEYGLSLVGRCDALLRINADIEDINYFQDVSPGADAEVRLAMDNGIPVFTTIDSLEDWLSGHPGGS